MVEDDENDVFFIQRALCRRAGISYPIHRAQDGEDAIAYLQGSPPYDDPRQASLPQIMLLDLKMPRKNGFRGHRMGA